MLINGEPLLVVCGPIDHALSSRPVSE